MIIAPPLLPSSPAAEGFLLRGRNARLLESSTEDDEATTSSEQAQSEDRTAREASGRKRQAEGVSVSPSPGRRRLVNVLDRSQRRSWHSSPTQQQTSAARPARRRLPSRDAKAIAAHKWLRYIATHPLEADRILEEETFEGVKVASIMEMISGLRLSQYIDSRQGSRREGLRPMSALALEVMPSQLVTRRSRLVHPEFAHPAHPERCSRLGPEYQAALPAYRRRPPRGRDAEGRDDAIKVWPPPWLKDGEVDPLLALQFERTILADPIDLWTEREFESFKRAYERRGKEFAEIAKDVNNEGGSKTRAQCVALYFCHFRT